MAQDAAALTAQRGQTHGDYPEMAGMVMALMDPITQSKNWDSLPAAVQVFLFNTAQKTARILTGNPFEPDHYADIEGYAYLARQAVSPKLEADTVYADRIELAQIDGSSFSADSIRTEPGPVSLDELSRRGVDLTEGDREQLVSVLETLCVQVSAHPTVVNITTTQPEDAASPAAAAPTSEEGDTGLAPIRPSPLPSAG